MEQATTKINLAVDTLPQFHCCKLSHPDAGPQHVGTIHIGSERCAISSVCTILLVLVPYVFWSACLGKVIKRGKEAGKEQFSIFNPCIVCLSIRREGVASGRKSHLSLFPPTLCVPVIKIIEQKAICFLMFL